MERTLQSDIRQGNTCQRAHAGNVLISQRRSDKSMKYYATEKILAICLPAGFQKLSKRCLDMSRFWTTHQVPCCIILIAGHVEAPVHPRVPEVQVRWCFRSGGSPHRTNGSGFGSGPGEGSCSKHGSDFMPTLVIRSQDPTRNH